MYLIIILECVKSSLDINIFKKCQFFFFIKISWPLMWLNWSIVTINATLQLLEMYFFFFLPLS